ncbi:MAG: hypothetical protein KIT69_09330 [Propionibacteriaceae bacterium]|nr:hypothetical protein [Propionibacteriaceae bacterium]
MRAGSWGRAVIAGMSAVVLAGCGLVSPVEPDDPAEPLPVIEIGSDGTATSELLAALYIAALQAGGDPAVVIDVTPGTETLALADGSPMAMPVYAASLLGEYTNDPLPTDAADTITDLATEVAPEIGVLETSRLDGGLVWAAAPESGLASLTDLAGLPAGTTAVAPGFAMTTLSGVPALHAAYGAELVVDQLDDPGERAAALAEGGAVAALFRRTEVTDLDGLVELDDPIGVTTPDPLVVAVSSAFAEQRPDAVLVLDAVQQGLNQDSYAGLVAAAAADGLEPAIAEWLAGHGLGG